MNRLPNLSLCIIAHEKISEGYSVSESCAHEALFFHVNVVVSWAADLYAAVNGWLGFHACVKLDFCFT